MIIMDTNGEQIIPDIDININEQSIVASSYANALWTPGFMHQTNETTYVYIDNPHDMIDPFHSNQNFMAIVLTHAITFIVGVIGNSVVIATWARGGKIRSPTATFLVSLACADLLLLIIFMPLETLEYFVITWDYNGHICKLSSFVELLSGMSSILNLVAVSVERFLVIVYPIHARHWCTVTKSRRSLIFVWILAIIFAAPPVFNKSTYSMTYYNNETAITAYYCFEKNDNWAIYFAIYELLTLFVIPALLMMFCYSRVIRELWTSTRVITILTSATNGYHHHHHHHPISEATSNHIMPNNKSAISETQSIGGSYHNNNGNSLTNGNTNGPRSYLVRWSNKKMIEISVVNYES
ncbi:galanin receptor type 1-like [Dermatophagoides pteronyssinus]|uniref:galanin receptor type 1-like n=1 Tax=Dermatophagoides pteronyssinus TaxID=6956 RepID=UPI003F67CDF4